MSLHRLLASLCHLVSRFCRASDGNIVVNFAIACIPIIGAMGTAVDYSKANDIKSQLQKSLDSAVLAGIVQPPQQQISTASGTFVGNFNARYGTSATASFTQNNDGSLTGSATSDVQASFLAVFGVNSIPVTATATASSRQSKSDVCILLVNPLRTQALLVNSGAKIEAPSCEIHVRSTQSPAAIFNDTLNVKRICVKGSFVIKNGGVKPPVETSCDAISDPFVGKLPTVSVGACDHNGQVYNPGHVTLSPGVYCGWTNFNGSGALTLNPGLYVIKNGGMIFNSGWSVTGTGVTFYLVDQNATITFNGNVTAKLSAPTSGTYANILMFEPNGLSNTNLPINGTSGSRLTGLMYLPSRDVIINSVSNMNTNNVTMVFSTLILNQTHWSIAAGALSMTASSGTGSAYLSR
ncbi:MAG: pilus assembly protein [Bradyrhizobium sp.]|uniref:TadE/TadG family type IV pilus assembly protein n=1 Tax=Bradyrhizobium sp. TaxID=376 RepID=UPI0025C0D5D6|nr:TadE/TadG family type IV pilus assembly protein [Bradyrhizobium sp.]MBI5260215.1 pilus assembly protein [Bradyrhizobium sp.]